MTPRAPAPRTTAGRTLLMSEDYPAGADRFSAMRDAILAIEAEAATAAVPEAPYDTEKGPTTQQVADSRFLERERASECDHGEGCICTELRHAGCCGALRTNVLASLATAAVPLDVERLAIAFDNLHLELVYVGPGYLLDPIPDLIAAEYERLRLSADKESET